MAISGIFCKLGKNKQMKKLNYKCVVRKVIVIYASVYDSWLWGCHKSISAPAEEKVSTSLPVATGLSLKRRRRR